MTAPDCPAPGECPVPSPEALDLRRLRTTTMAAGTSFFIAYRRGRWPAIFNASGRGDARFSPLPAAHSVVPTLYGARSRTCALLESVFHEVHAGGERVISAAIDLAPYGLVRLTCPEPLKLFDLRDGALEALGIPRHGLVSTLPVHYPCTREWAAALHARGAIGGSRAVGLLWASRIAELARGDSALLRDLLDAPTAEVFLLFGDRVPTDPGRYAPSERYDDLSGEEARTLVEQVADQLGAVIVSAE